MNTQKAMFAAGCFWGVEKKFYDLNGVTATEVGYSGGDLQNPSYEDVCSESTGHAEVVLVEFDTEIISYEELVKYFFEIHNPMTRNRQGPDIGSQYRSIIFFFDENQKKIAVKLRDSLNETKFEGGIATEILPKKEFYRAEEYHQKYLMK